MNGFRQGELDFNRPKIVPIEHIDTRGWRRLSVATGRCLGKCSECTCISDLQTLARDAAMGALPFGPSGKPLLNLKQIGILRSKRDKSVLDESTDSSFIVTDVAPAPLETCNDNEL